jgi:signal transduction histidine kinase
MKVASRKSAHCSPIDRDALQQARLASLGELAHGIAHELNNALTGVLGFTQILSMRSGLPPAAREDLARIRADAERCRDAVYSLLAFARGEDTHEDFVSLNDVVQQAVRLRQYEWRGADIALHLELAPDLPRVRASFQQMEQVLVDLVLNAEFRLTQSRTAHRQIVIASRPAEDGSGVTLEVQDNARGAESARGVGRSAHRRLAVAQMIVEQHSGSMELLHGDGQGMRCVLRMPAADAVPAPVPAS